MKKPSLPCAIAALLSIVMPLQHGIADPTPSPLTTPQPALANSPGVHIADGPFKPTWESLAASYKCPECSATPSSASGPIGRHSAFRAGRLVRRGMYEEGSPNYKYSLQHHGPQSQFRLQGLRPPLDRRQLGSRKLMALYKRAGARYFMALAIITTTSIATTPGISPGNSTRVGPMKDMSASGRRSPGNTASGFAVSNHSSTHGLVPGPYGYDTAGPYQGIPCDGWLTKADGRASGGEGLDPQDLYAGPATPRPRASTPPPTR